MAALGNQQIARSHKDSDFVETSAHFYPDPNQDSGYQPAINYGTNNNEEPFYDERPRRSPPQNIGHHSPHVGDDNLPEFDTRKQRIIRTSIVVLFSLLMTLAALGGAFLVADDIECIEDRIFDMTAGLNNFFAVNKSAKYTMMIICGLMMDIMVLTQFYRFAMFGSSWRFLICLAAFYIFRFICQQLFYFKYPQGYLWEFPGFYSVTVPYGKTNDFFFSGHVGCCVINFLEFRACGWQRLARFSIATAVMQTFLMVALRGHYFIDLISGVIFAHYAWMLAERYSYLVDVNIFRIPFKKRFPLFTQSCTKCQHPVSIWVDHRETTASAQFWQTSPNSARFRQGGEDIMDDDKAIQNYPYTDRGGI